VIIPVYNVARYLPACLDSVLCQDGCSLEVILIDDGSTDQSGRICDQYAAGDPRIKVIHQANAGAAAAKNAGLRIATGEYLAFADSDDFLEPGVYRYMLDQLCAHDADVIQCAFRNVFTDRSEDVVTLPDFTVYETKEYLTRYTQDWTCGLLWDKLYRRKLFDGIFFEEGHKIDDEFFTYQGIMNAGKILHSPSVIYNYRKRRSGVMLSSESGRKILADKVDYLSARRVKVAVRFPELKSVFDYHYLNMMVILSADAAATEDSICYIRKSLQAYFREGKICKIEFTLAYKLLRLMILPPKKLLRYLREVSPGRTEQYFD
jgi:glycosyltransferase involved in cell wall biosynthesis